MIWIPIITIVASLISLVAMIWMNHSMKRQEEAMERFWAAIERGHERRQ